MICEVIQPFNYQNLKRNTKLKFTNFAKKLDCCLGFSLRSQSFVPVTSSQCTQSVRLPDFIRPKIRFVAKPFAPRNDMKRKFAFTLAEGATHIAKSAAPRRAAFTLAEVLITLGIIGVVAAMTLPTLIQNHRKHEVETKLAKTYSVVNQAIKLSTVEYGEPAEWGDWDCGISNAPTTCTIDEAMEKFNKYIGKNLQIMEIKKADNNELFYVYLNDGGILALPKHLYDMVFYINNKAIDNTKYGINTFNFRFSPKILSSQDPNNPNIRYTINPTFEPYSFSWNGTMEGLTDSSNNYACGGKYNALCTKLIQLNGWKIPKDYPLKF